MRIAFATLYDARDINRGSGSSYHLTKELQRQGHDVQYVGPFEFSVPPITRLLRRLSSAIGKRYSSFQDVFVAQKIGAAFTRELKKIDCDVIITNDYVIAGYSVISKPIILYTDAMFPRKYEDNIHPWAENLSKISVYSSQHVTRRGLTHSDLCVFAARFALDEALKYGIDPQKVHCIPYGANLLDIPHAETTTRRRLPEGTAENPVQLLFVGKYWQLKGGEIAINVISELRQRGIEARLHIVGPDPIPEYADSSIIFQGFLDKGKEEDRRTLKQLYENCDILLLPSIAEGFGVAYVEAAAYGMPSLGYNTTGVRTAVSHNQSGLLLPLGAEASSFANVIESWIQDNAVYQRFATGARSYFEDTVNWQVAVTELMRIISEKVIFKATP